MADDGINWGSLVGKGVLATGVAVAALTPSAAVLAFLKPAANMLEKGLSAVPVINKLPPVVSAAILGGSMLAGGLLLNNSSQNASLPTVSGNGARIP